MLGWNDFQLSALGPLALGPWLLGFFMRWAVIEARRSRACWQCNVVVPTFGGHINFEVSDCKMELPTGGFFSPSSKFLCFLTPIFLGGGEHLNDGNRNQA